MTTIHKPSSSPNVDEPYRIVNVITTADLRQHVNAIDFNNYSWGRFDLIDNYNGKVGYVKDGKIQGRVTVFLSGKMISTGGKSIENSIFQLQHVMNILVKNGFVKKVSLLPVVRNVVACAYFGSKVDLNMLARLLPRSIYEPEQFPGLIHKTLEGVSVLLFASGKLVITGARSERQISDLVKNMSDSIKPFRI